MKPMDWRLKTALILILISVVLYSLIYVVFHDAKAVLFYIGIDFAFIPLEVLIVVLVIERAITEKEKAMMLEKLNMVIGAFFSEVGTELLKEISEFDPNKDIISKNLLIAADWTEGDFSVASNIINNQNYSIILKSDQDKSISFLKDTKLFLTTKREFLLGLLENPNLLEHETFTDMLWAVFHLTEELDHRNDLENLPQADYQHLSLDTERVYSFLIYEWLQYMEHIQKNYPYLFSMAIRTNPFNSEAQIEIKD
jgi:hypothetical protein